MRLPMTLGSGGVEADTTVDGTKTGVQSESLVDATVEPTARVPSRSTIASVKDACVTSDRVSPLGLEVAIGHPLDRCQVLLCVMDGGG